MEFINRLAFVEQDLFKIFDFLTRAEINKLNVKVIKKLNEAISLLIYNKQIELIASKRKVELLYNEKLKAEKLSLQHEEELEELSRYKKMADLLVQILN